MIVRPFNALVLVIGAAFAVPFAYLGWRAAAEPSATWSVISSARSLGPLWRTLQLAVLVSLITAVVGTSMAWLVERTDLPGGGSGGSRRRSRWSSPRSSPLPRCSTRSTPAACSTKCSGSARSQTCAV